MIDKFCSESLFNTEIVSSTIVDKSFLAERFTLADGAYSIIDLNSKKMLIIKFKDKQRSEKNLKKKNQSKVVFIFFVMNFTQISYISFFKLI